MLSGKDRIAYDSLVLKDLSYGGLQLVKQQLADDLRRVKNMISDMEMCPDRDEEIGEWSESEYLKKMDMAERSMETEW